MNFRTRAAAIPMALGSHPILGFSVADLMTAYRTGERDLSSVSTGFHEKEMRDSEEVLRKTEAPYLVQQSWWTSVCDVGYLFNPFATALS